MKPFAILSLGLMLAASFPALAASTTGLVTYIGPDGDQVVLNRHDVYAVAPDVSLDHVSVMQRVTVTVSDENGTRTIIGVSAGPADRVPEARDQSRPAQIARPAPAPVSTP